jgi:hypothetical protein
VLLGVFGISFHVSLTIIVITVMSTKRRPLWQMLSAKLLSGLHK